jgi:hypothetical protein
MRYRGLFKNEERMIPQLERKVIPFLLYSELQTVFKCPENLPTVWCCSIL